jgi:tyrosinase
MLNRRNLLVSASGAALSSFVWNSRAKAATTFVRSDASTPAGQKMLGVYAEGVKRMKALPASDPRSWTFQWYTHAIPPATRSTPVGETIATALKNTFGDVQSPARALAEKAWYTCQTHQQGQQSDYFLPWHRLYVLYLEKIVRELTGVADFALPYWNYTSPNAYSIPVEFQTVSRTNPNYASLYQRNRNKNSKRNEKADVNAGEPINLYNQGADNFLNLDDMNPSDYATFDKYLNQNLHGNVHDFTGDGANMGYVPTAAEDPIFWLHHCNIDRIWYGWNAYGNVNPTETAGVNWSDIYFAFADASGAAVTSNFASVSNNATLPYTYDALPVPPAPIARPAALVVASAQLSVNAPAGAVAGAAETGAPVDLGATRTTVRLAPTAPENQLSTMLGVPGAAPAGRLIVRLRDVQVQDSPGIVYKLYLDLPADASPEVATQHFVGIVNFFGVVPAGGHGGHAGHGGAGQVIEFDVTRLAASLAASGSLASETSVTLIPVGEPAAGSEPKILGGIELRKR